MYVFDLVLSHISPSDSFAYVGIVSPACRENNLVKNKIGAQIILTAILNRPIDVDLLEYCSELEAHNTIVEAPPVDVAAGVEVEKEQ